MIRRWFPRDPTRELLELGTPIVLGMLSQTVLNLVDTAMVGRLGPAPQAAVGLGSFAFWVLASGVLGIGAAVQATVSRRDREGDTDAAGATLDNGLLLAFVVGLPLGWGVAQAAPAILSTLTDDAQVATGGAGYLAIRLVALGAVAANACLCGFFHGIGRGRVHMTILALSHAANVLLNWVFIYGNLGAAPMGVRGAALASVLATVLATCLYTGLALARRETRTRYRPFQMASLTCDRLVGLMRLSWPEGVRGGVLTLGCLLLLRLHAILGTREVAAGTILLALSSAGALPGLGIGMACRALVRHHLERGEPEVARSLARLGGRMAVVAIGLPGLAAALFAGPLLGLFTQDALVLDAARPALRLASVSVVLDALPTVLGFSLLGAGATRLVAGIQAGQRYLLLLPLAAVLGIVLHLGVIGIWLAVLISRLALAGVALLAIRGTWWTRTPG